MDREQQTYQALLALVAEADQYPGSSLIAERIGLSPKTKAQVTVYLKRLVEKGLVVQMGKLYLPRVCTDAARERSGE